MVKTWILIIWVGSSQPIQIPGYLDKLSCDNAQLAALTGIQRNYGKAFCIPAPGPTFAQQLEQPRR